MSKKIVISAVNLTEGGPLTVLRQCLQAAKESLPKDWEIVALVHNNELINTDGVQCMTFPASKRSWLRRIYHEYILFYFISKKIDSDIWFSLHDITPFVQTKFQVLYCHNPSPFYKSTLNTLRMEPYFFLFTKFYKYLYRINIHRNALVVVQQNWLRHAFREMYGIDNIVVAHPVSTQVDDSDNLKRTSISKSSGFTFFYPALSRIFKNFEVVCEATIKLASKFKPDFQVILTIDGSENKYSSYIVKKYSQSPHIKFIGKKTSKEVEVLYRNSDAVIFPSKLETWGLPISEAKQFGKHILLADLPYAHETIGDYSQVSFFNPDDSDRLAYLMDKLIRGEIPSTPHTHSAPQPPYAADWKELFNIMINEYNGHQNKSA